MQNQIFFFEIVLIFLKSWTVRHTVCIVFTGFHPLGSMKNVPNICSKKKCTRLTGRVDSAWEVTQHCDGCGCCEYNSTLICDGSQITTSDGKKLQCCEGELLVPNTEASSTEGYHSNLFLAKFYHVYI